MYGPVGPLGRVTYQVLLEWESEEEKEGGGRKCKKEGEREGWREGRREEGRDEEREKMRERVK